MTDIAFDTLRESRGRMERVLYRGRATHTSKSDDDLPAIRWTGLVDDPGLGATPMQSAARRTLGFLLGALVAGGALAAVIALRLAIWLPTYIH